MEEGSKQIAVGLTLSPEGHVYLDTSGLTGEFLSPSAFAHVEALFAKGPAMGLLHLGIRESSFPLPPSFLFWHSVSRAFFTHVCRHSQMSEEQGLPKLPSPNPNDLKEFVNQAPCFRGIEYLDSARLLGIWHSLEGAFHEALQEASCNVQDYLRQHSPLWNLVGRVCFHLAENKNDELRPFAFLATYTTRLSGGATARHLPLKRALEEYNGEENRALLLSLLVPVQKAASQSPFIQTLVDSGSIFQTLAWTPQEALRFLRDMPLIEASGVVVRVPNWWNAQKPPRAQVTIQVGQSQKSNVGLDSLLDFDMHLALANGERLTREEWASILETPGDLIKVKGQWVEVNREKLQEVLSYWSQMQQATQEGLTMAQSLRLLAGMGTHSLGENDALSANTTADWSKVVAGDWLRSLLEGLRNPDSHAEEALEKVLNQYLKGSLRPYQLTGVQWLWLLYQLRLGGCLADDMGLGKTIQVLSLLLMVKYHPVLKSKKPHLLVVPASLLGNWQAEAARFSPTLSLLIAHNSASDRDFTHFTAESLDGIDIVITTYAYIHRLKWLSEVHWDLIILDEAQLIKNPGTKQTRAVKALKSNVRLALSGTPIENRLGDLWSVFDFTAPGLLGSHRAFTEFSKQASKVSVSAYGRFVSTLRGLTQPYILRRLKSDKRIIGDLPDKTEIQAFCGLSKQQAHLYEHAVNELKQQLKEAKGIQRRGLVLSYLMRFKQICNHPVQWIGYGDYAEELSGKFVRLREICEEISAKQEKVLVFTQFQEIIPALATFLAKVFGREGLTLSGDTAIGKRSQLVTSFQEELGPPFFILSLKAGGTGLNLTRASHVVHFDRWWNPAVENQATDRAYRIGQKHPVMVHKFVCRGTIEEKIDALIASKQKLAKDLLEGDSSVLLTELTNEELINMISLDLNRAMTES